MRIEDGTGSGFKAEVDNLNRLQVFATSETVLTKSSRSGNAFQGKIGITPVIGGVTTSVIYIKNTDESKDFLFDQFILSYNGGDTNRNRVATMFFATGPVAPTANFIVSGAGNMNQSSGTQPNLDVNIWDGVGAGMTFTNPGIIGGEALIPQGVFTIRFGGALIMGPGDSLQASVIAEESGDAAIFFNGFFE